jgi:hypothetical protein
MALDGWDVDTLPSVELGTGDAWMVLSELVLLLSELRVLGMLLRSPLLLLLVLLAMGPLLAFTLGSLGVMALLLLLSLLLLLLLLLLLPLKIGDAAEEDVSVEFAFPEASRDESAAFTIS